MSDDVSKASASFLVVALLLTLFASYSFFSPLSFQSETPWQESLARVLAHYLPVVPPLVVGMALRYHQVWAWYVGLVFMAAMFCLGIFLSLEHFAYIIHGHFIPPVFFIFSLAATPSLFLLLRGKMSLLRVLKDGKA